MEDESPSRQIDNIIKLAGTWQGEKLYLLRKIILEANPNTFEEVKWKKPSKPEGVAVWSYEGIICVADILKNAVRLTFPKGAQIKDPAKLFNTRLDSKTVRGIDFTENMTVDGNKLKGLVQEAVSLNKPK